MPIVMLLQVLWVNALHDFATALVYSITIAARGHTRGKAFVVKGASS